MIDGYRDPDAAANLLERRWFSSITAVRVAEAECEAMREVLELAESAWRRARIELAELECLRDALGDELAALDEVEIPSRLAVSPRAARPVLSVA
jgi:hypothetical protein